LYVLSSFVFARSPFWPIHHHNIISGHTYDSYQFNNAWYFFTEARGDTWWFSPTRCIQPLKSVGLAHEGVIMSCATLHVAKLPDSIREIFAAEIAVLAFKAIWTTRHIAATGALSA
jgi:hypothetical protein